MDPLVQHTVSVYDNEADRVGFRNASQDTVIWTLGQCRLNDDPSIEPSYLVFTHDPDFINEMCIDYTAITFPCWELQNSGGLNMELAPDEGIILRKGFDVMGTGCETFRFKVIENGINIDSIDIEYCTSLGIEEQQVWEVQVYPNPAQDKIAFSSEAKEIQLFDLWGSRLKYADLLESHTEMSITDLVNGVYIVQFQTSDGRFIRQSLVVQK